MRDKCKFWLIEEMTNTQTGERKLVQDCLIIHLYTLSRQGVVETIRQIATTDKVAAATDKVSEILVRGIYGPRPLPGKPIHSLQEGDR
jgi:hypothetical protein